MTHFFLFILLQKVLPIYTINVLKKAFNVIPNLRNFQFNPSLFSHSISFLKKHNNFIIKITTVTTIIISKNNRSYFCFCYRHIIIALTSLFDELLLSSVPSSSSNIRTTTGSSVNTEFITIIKYRIIAPKFPIA